MAGAGIATTLTTAIGPSRLPFVAAFLLEATVFCFHRISHDGEPRDGAVDVPPRHSLWDLARTLSRSPYLGAIAGYMLLYTITSTFAYLEQARLVQSSVVGDAARTALFARMDLWVNVASIALQALATRWLLARAGVTITLLLLPILTLAGFAALALRSSLILVVGFQVARRTTDYFAARPARELCYVVVDRDAKYAAKSFIDTFVYRGGDALGAGAFGLVGVIAPVVAIAVCTIWLAIAFILGRMQHRLSRS
jgi:AAA family ATP:ADP antiporter